MHAVSENANAFKHSGDADLPSNICLEAIKILSLAKKIVVVFVEVSTFINHKQNKLVGHQ